MGRSFDCRYHRWTKELELKRDVLCVRDAVRYAHDTLVDLGDHPRSLIDDGWWTSRGESRCLTGPVR